MPQRVKQGVSRAYFVFASGKHTMSPGESVGVKTCKSKRHYLSAKQAHNPANRTRERFAARCPTARLWPGNGGNNLKKRCLNSGRG